MFDGLHGATAKDIVSRVRKPFQLSVNEKALKAIRGRAAEVESEIRRLVAERTDANLTAINDKLVRLDAERRELASRFAPAVQAVVAERGPYLEKCDEALGPYRRAAAQRALAAIDALTEAVAALDDADRAFRSVGGEVQPRPGIRGELRTFASWLNRRVIGTTR